MNKEAVQHERGPRTATIRKQMEQFRLETLRYSPFASSPSVSPMSTMSSPPSSPYLNTSISPAPPATSTSSPLELCESAARILLSNSNWMKSVPNFAELTADDQSQILSSCWLQLFLLSLSQVQTADDLSVLAAQADLSADEMNELHHLKDVFARLATMKLDAIEFTCLRSLLLFRSNVQIQSSIATYISLRKPQDPLRVGSLLMQMTSFGSISSRLVHKLFFSTIDSNVSIDNLVVDIFHRNTTM